MAMCFLAIAWITIGDCQKTIPHNDRALMLKTLDNDRGLPKFEMNTA